MFTSVRKAAGPLALLALGSALTASAAVLPLTVSKSFYPPIVPLNGTTTMEITLNNSNPLSTNITGVSVTDTLPPGLTIVPPTPFGTAPGCFSIGTITISPNSLTVVGTKLVGKGGCIIFVTVQGVAVGPQTNTTSAITSNETAPVPGPTAVLSVVQPETLTKTFGELAIPVGGTTSLTFTLTNRDGNQQLTGLRFIDTLPAGLAVATPNGLMAPCPMGGAIISAIPGSGAITLTGATLPPGGTCTISVNVTGTAIGAQNNTTTMVNSNESIPGLPATASIYVGAQNVTSQVLIGLDQFAPDRNSRNPNWCTVMTLINPSTPVDRNARASAIAGPIEIVLTDLSPNATLQNPAGTLGGWPYVIVQPTALPPGGQATAPLCFLNPSAGPITFVPRIYTGALP